MSAPASNPTAGPAPVVNHALEPSWVRQGSTATKQAYATALGFEQVLVEQLAKSMAATSGFGEGSEEGESSAGGSGGASSTGGDAGSSAMTSMLPQALASGVMSAGGLGLAAQITRQLDGGQLSPDAARTGGTARTGATAQTGGAGQTGGAAS